MQIRSLAKFTCRCCAVSVEAGAGRCHQCGVAHPTSALRAVAFSPTAISLYLAAALGLITLWFLMAPEGRFRKPPLPAARVDNFSRGHALDTLSAPNPVRCGGPSHENGRAAPDLRCRQSSN